MNEQALIDAIFARREEDETALVYADWLEEHGQPDRAALIRLEARLDRASTRSDELLRERQEQEKRCAAALPLSPGLRKKLTVTFRRGLATAELKLSATLTPAHLRELAGIACLTSMAAFHRLPTPRLAQLALCPNVRELLCGTGAGGRSLTSEDWQAISGLGHVERLSLRSIYVSFGDEVTAPLAAMGRLKAVDLVYSGVSDAGVANLSSALSGLEELRLGSGSRDGPGVGDAGAEAIAVGLRRLRVLDLMGQERLTDAGLARLAALKELTYLDVGGTSVKDPMPVVTRMKKLRYLGLTGMRISDADVQELAKRLPALRKLDLRRHGVTRFRLSHLLPKTKWRRVRLEADMGMGRSEEKEVEAFREFCRERDVFAEVEWE